MKVGVLGSGVVGQTLARGFTDHGHDVRIGTRTPARLSDYTASSGVRAVTFAEAVDHGELVVFATLGSAASDVIDSVGADRFAGKVVMDATNPLTAGQGRARSLFVSGEDSLGERIQRAVPAAKVVKCFNTVSAMSMVDPQFATGPATMFLAGDDEGAKSTVSDVVRSFGWEPFDLGGLEAARLLEAMTLLWVAVGVRRGAWNHAFTLVENRR